MSLPAPFDRFRLGSQILIHLGSMPDELAQTVMDLCHISSNTIRKRNVIRAKVLADSLRCLGWASLPFYQGSETYRGFPMITVLDFEPEAENPVGPIDDLSDLLGGGF